MASPKRVTHRVSVKVDPYPKTAPGLFQARCRTCHGAVGLSRRTREEAEDDVTRHLHETEEGY